MEVGILYGPPSVRAFSAAASTAQDGSAFATPAYKHNKKRSRKWREATYGCAYCPRFQRETKNIMVNRMPMIQVPTLISLTLPVKSLIRI